MAEEIDTKEFAWISEVFKKKEVFTGLSYTEREALIEDMYKISYKPEDIIFKEGDDPTACFLIYKGKVKGTKNKMLVLKKEVSTLGPGSFFWGDGFSHLCAARGNRSCRRKYGLFCSSQIHLPEIVEQKPCL